MRGALALWWARPRPFSFRLTADGIETDVPGQCIVYEDIEGVRAHGVANPPARESKKSFALSVFHRERRFDVPAPIDASSAELFHFLWDRQLKSGSREVNALLVPYLEKQEATFGPEKVFTFRSLQRPVFGKPKTKMDRCQHSDAGNLSRMDRAWRGRRKGLRRLASWRDRAWHRRGLDLCRLVGVSDVDEAP